MKLVGIDIGKQKHYFSVMDRDTGDILDGPAPFTNTREGFMSLLSAISPFQDDGILVGMEDTGHYHFNLLKFLVDRNFSVALINPSTTSYARKMGGGITKNDRLDTLTICSVLSSPAHSDLYRTVTGETFELYEQKLMTRHHHQLKEEMNVLKNRLQKSIDIVFPEFNSLFHSRYSRVYMNILKTFGSAENIARADIRTIRRCFEVSGRGRQISLTAEELKERARNSIGFSTPAEVLKIRQMVETIEFYEEQLAEVDKKIEEFSVRNNSPILSIPGISHFSGTSIIAELGDISNYSDPGKVTKFAGMAPSSYESGKYTAKHCAITKKGSKYLRKTLYQIIIPVINNNPVFKRYYQLKLSQGKGSRCAQGHCIRKLLRVIYHLLTTGEQFNPEFLR